METKRAKVIMLPTKDSTSIGLLDNKRLGYIDGMMCNGDWKFVDKNWKRQHLYITTDDEIKEGDWFINELSYEMRCDTINKETGWLINNEDESEWQVDKSKKIIATTDKSLTVNYSGYEYGTAREINANVYLPQPSQAFIEKYCKLGGIDEVLVEYYNSCQCNDYVEHAYRVEDKECSENYIKLKVDSHNTITIHPIKDSWSRDEVMDLVSTALFSPIPPNISEAVEWIKENL